MLNYDNFPTRPAQTQVDSVELPRAVQPGEYLGTRPADATVMSPWETPPETTSTLLNVAKSIEP